MIRRGRQLVTLAKNLWFLRRELWRVYVRRQPAQPAKPPPLELRCLRCKRPLTKPCKPVTRAHVFAWPEQPAHPEFEPGQLVYVRQTHGDKPAELRSQPF